MASVEIDQQDFANLLFQKYLNNRLPKYYVVYSIEEGLRAFRLHAEAKEYVLRQVLKVQEEKPEQLRPTMQEEMLFPNR
jgi:hypothetical protein